MRYFVTINLLNYQIWFELAYSTSTWGNMVRDTGEGCDDANVISGDGWSELWVVESGWSWTGGSATTKDICSETCGDGKRSSTLSTSWDDGNTINGDGCSSSWVIEVGWNWSGGTPTTKDTWTEVCGDGKRFNSISAYWDDGNTINGDGCSSTCTIETGFTWTGGSSSTQDTWIEVCGDGKRFNSISTYWDDGNTINGDGWSSTCSIETGFVCNGGSTTSIDIWKEICGDGKRYNSLSTFCDDGNNINGDGCSSLCATETGYSWSGGSSSTKDTWSEIWGDGIRITIVFLKPLNWIYQSKNYCQKRNYK